VSTLDELYQLRDHAPDRSSAVAYADVISRLEAQEDATPRRPSPMPDTAQPLTAEELDELREERDADPARFAWVYGETEARLLATLDAVAEERDRLRGLLGYLWTAEGGRFPDVPVNTLFHEDDLLVAAVRDALGDSR
jgi:hypothetical protein